MDNKAKNGTVSEVEGKECIFYDGHWIRHYQSNTNTLVDKKKMIDQLTRRVFHNVEPGINTPGYRVEEIRQIFEQETNPAKKRVKGAMLAGALLNRGRDILNAIVELEEAGVKIETNNELLERCGKCFVEALVLGENIKLANGDESVAELWGEPFRVFSLPIEEFFESRYIKIAQTMTEIDQVTEIMLTVIDKSPIFADAKDKTIELSKASKLACETLRSDPVIFEVWPRYVVAKESFEAFKPNIDSIAENGQRLIYKEGYELIREGGSLLTMMSSLRIPIEDSVKSYIDKCKEYSV